MKKLQNKVNTLLKRFFDNDKMDQNLYYSLRATTANIPLFYGLIKLHKLNHPIRTIVSFLDSPTYNISKFISNLLMPLTNKSQYKLKNTFETKEFLQNQQLPSGYSLASFDVKSLFTCIPHSYALNAVQYAIDNDFTSLQGTLLSKDEIMLLIKICLESTSFQWGNQLYTQDIGTPMGSPLSVVIAELSMQFLENDIVNNSPFPLAFWKRFVDDIIAALPENSLDYFLDYINNINNNFKFEIEKENNRSLAFLDLKITRLDDNTFKFNIFRKATHTGQYLNFNSHNPVCHKKAVASSLFNRSKLVCSGKDKVEEDNIIKQQLKMNNYPDQFIKKVSKFK